MKYVFQTRFAKPDETQEAMPRALRGKWEKLRQSGPLSSVLGGDRFQAARKSIRASGIFEAAWYLEEYSDVKRAGVDPLGHYLEHGAAEGRNPGPLFLTSWYLKQIPATIEVAVDPISHYLTSGARLGLSPHPLFDGQWYLKSQRDLHNLDINPLVHYIQSGSHHRRNPHPLFDSRFYCDQIPASLGDARTPLHHYLRGGWKRVSGPHPLFDCHWYGKRYPHFRDSGLDPLSYYLAFGYRDGDDPFPLFDWRYFSAEVDETCSADVSPFVDYLIQPVSAEERQPHPLFNADELRDQNANLQKLSSAEILRDYVEGGVTRNLRPHPDFDSSHYERYLPQKSGLAGVPLAHFLGGGAVDGCRPNAQWDRVLQHWSEMLLPDIEQWYDEDQPQVSLVILNFNNAPMTRRCLQTIWRNTRGYRYEIVVVDNGSEPNDLMQLQQFNGRFRLLRVGVNRFYGEGNNLGVEAARGEYIVFLNNDAFVGDEWLPPLIDPLVRNQEVGATGPKFVYPDGRLQEAGALILPDGNALQRGKGGQPDDPEFNEPRVVDYCSAATLAMSKQLFVDVLGFDLIWEPAYYEDSDLCLKIAAKGKQVWYCPDSTVIHIENKTTSNASHGLKLNNIVEINKVKFLQRWFPRGKRALAALPEPLQERSHDGSRLENAESIGLYTPYALIPGGGERYLLSLAEFLSRKAKVTLLVEHQYSDLRLQTVARDLGLDLSAVALRVRREVRSATEFDLFIAMGNDLLPPCAGLGRVNIFHSQFPFPISSADFFRRLAHVSDYSKVIVNSAFTQAAYQQQRKKNRLPSVPVEVLHPCVAPPASVDEEPVERNIILSVGRIFAGGHNKRHDVLIRAFIELLPELDGRPELHIAGSLHPEAQHREWFLELQEQAAGHPIVFHLNTGADTLGMLYRRAVMYWHAAGFGVDVVEHPEQCEHFGITPVEAMLAGCVPVACSAGGPSEIIQHGHNGFLYSDLPELKKYARQVWAMRRDSEWEVLSQAAISRGQDFSPKKFQARARELLLN